MLGNAALLPNLFLNSHWKTI